MGSEWCRVVVKEVASAAQVILHLCEDANTLPLFAEVQGQLKKAQAELRQAPSPLLFAACRPLHQGHESSLGLPALSVAADCGCREILDLIVP